MGYFIAFIVGFTCGQRPELLRSAAQKFWAWWQNK
jgi:hypothetical protein